MSSPSGSRRSVVGIPEAIGAGTYDSIDESPSKSLVVRSLAKNFLAN